MSKKMINCVIFAILIGILCICTKSYATTGITYYTRGAMIIENAEKIKIQEYSTVINTETSIVEEKILLANIAKEDTVTEIKLPLEDKELGIAVKDLEIKVNNLKINSINKNDKGEYIFKVKINAGEGKKIEIKYSTESNLRDAKIIKYNFSNIDLNDRSIGKLKFDIVFPEADVPLVTEIYPGHYTFDNNTVTVEYYNFTINSLTENIIIEKNTYGTLLGNRETSIEDIMAIYPMYRADKDKDKEIKENILTKIYEFIKKAPKYVDGTLKLEYVKNEFHEYGENYEVSSFDESFYQSGYKKQLETFIENIFGKESSIFIMYYTPEIYNICVYILDKLHIENGYQQDIAIWESDYSYYNPLVIRYKLNNWKSIKNTIELKSKTDENGNYQWENLKKEISVILKDKLICVDYSVKRKNEKLYQYFYKSYDDDGNASMDLQEKEKEINELDVYALNFADYGGSLGVEPLCRIVYIGKYANTIIDATDKEKAEYVNMINADMYIKYDLIEVEETNSQVDYFETIIGFYGENNREIAKNTKTRWDIQWEKEDGVSRSHEVKEINNDETLKNLNIPAVIMYVGKIVIENGKKFVEGGYFDNPIQQIEMAETALKTEQAQKLVAENRSKNDRIKQTMEKKIADLVITTDVEEYSETVEIVENSDENESNTEQNAYIDILVLSLVGVASIICLIVIIVDVKRKNKF